MKRFSVIVMILAMMSVMSCTQKKNEAPAVNGAAVEVSAPKKSKKAVVARVVVKEGKESAFIQVASALEEATRKEPGCLFYTLYQSATNPRMFVFYEEYKDDAAFQAHAGSPHFKVFADAIPDMLAGDLIVDEY